MAPSPRAPARFRFRVFFKKEKENDESGVGECLLELPSVEAPSDDHVKHMTIDERQMKREKQKMG